MAAPAGPSCWDAARGVRRASALLAVILAAASLASGEFAQFAMGVQNYTLPPLPYQYDVRSSSPALAPAAGRTWLTRCRRLWSPASRPRS